MKSFLLTFAIGVSAQHWSYGWHPGGKKRDPAYATGNYRIEDRSYDDLTRSRPKPASFEEYSEMQPADRAAFILDTVKDLWTALEAELGNSEREKKPFFTPIMNLNQGNPYNKKR